jgi:hypothetical protein
MHQCRRAQRPAVVRKQQHPTAPPTVSRVRTAVVAVAATAAVVDVRVGAKAPQARVKKPVWSRKTWPLPAISAWTKTMHP